MKIQGLSRDIIESTISKIREESKEPNSSFRTRSRKLATVGKHIVKASYESLATEYRNSADRFFLVTTGSLGRKGDFLLPSDLDFVVFPITDDDANDARNLHSSTVSKVNCLVERVPFKADTKMDRGSGIAKPPYYYTGNRLQPIYPMPVAPDMQEHTIEVPNIHRILRDIEFLSGNRDAYNYLANGVTERIYTNGNDNDEFSAQLKREITIRIKKWKPYTVESVKDDIVRVYQFTGWLLRVRNKTPNSRDFFDDINNSTLGEEDKRKLTEAFEYFLKLKEYLYWIDHRRKDLREDIGLIVNNELKINPNALDDDKSKHLKNSLRIIRKIID